MNVKGLSIAQIMDIDLDTFNKMKESDLRHITSRLVSAGNKRIRRLMERGIESPAIVALKGRTGFSTQLPDNVTKDQRVNQLRKTYAEVREFLSYKTSTISGYNQMVKNMKNTLKKDYDVELNGTQIKQIVKVMNRLKRDRKISGRGSESSKKMFTLLARRSMYYGQIHSTKDYKMFSTWADKSYLKSQGADVDINVFEDETDEIIID